MKIDGIEGLRVSIRVGGSDLQEYDDASATDNSGYLPKAINQTLGLTAPSTPSKADSLQCDVFLDGQHTTGLVSYINHHKDDYSKDIESAYKNHNGKFTRRSFQFADLTTNDGASKGFDVWSMKSLGEIQLEFRWCRTGKTIPAEQANLHVRHAEQNAIPEKCLNRRAISSQAVLGAGKPCTGSPSIQATNPYGPVPFATYIFQNRSHRDLQIEGIIPRSPSPQPGIPLEERDPATLSIEEARELVRILLERHGGRMQVKNEVRPEVKHESAKSTRSQMAAVEEDDDDLTVLSEGRSSKRMRGATDDVVDCIDLTGT